MLDLAPARRRVITIGAGIAAMVAMLGCPGDNEAMREHAEGAAVPAADSPASAAPQDPEPPTLAAPAPASGGEPAAVERGIGIVLFFEGDGISEAGSGEDTLMIRPDTMSSAVLARFIHRRSGRSWQYVVEAHDSVSGSSLEFGSEVDGLPVERATGDGRWVRVIHGQTNSGALQYGWVQVSPGRAQFQRWSNVLPDRPLFFAEGITPEFHGSARGKMVEFPLRERNGRHDYIMYPMQVQGEWMQVRVVTPADVCGVEEAVRQSLLWIRYLDEQDRPRVWFHTRGC